MMANNDKMDVSKQMIKTKKLTTTTAVQEFPCHFTSLPEEIVLCILHCDAIKPMDIVNFSRTCKRNFDIARDIQLWIKKGPTITLSSCSQCIDESPLPPVSRFASRLRIIHCTEHSTDEVAFKVSFKEHITLLSTL